MLAGATSKPGGKGKKSKQRTGVMSVARQQIIAGPNMKYRGVACTTSAPVIATASPAASAYAAVHAQALVRYSAARVVR